MLVPKSRKFRKSFKLQSQGLKENKGFFFGVYSLKTMKSGRISSRQIEAARKAITRKMKREGQLWIHLFPHIPVTSKPTEVRMGKGKGSISYWVITFRAGQVLFEVDGVSLEIAKKALSYGAGKLPIRTQFIVENKNKFF